jgi:Flp pilus assembly protein TadD
MHAAWHLYDEARHRLAHGDRPGAILCLRRSLDIQPTNFEAQSLLAYVLHAHGEAPAAIAAMTIACILEPTRAHAHAELGRWHLAADHPADAIPPLERATRLRPDDAQMIHDLGLAYLRTADDPAAIATLTRATILAPHDPQILTDLALAHARSGALDDAQAVFTRAWEIAPEDRGTWERALSFMLEYGRPLSAALDLLAPAALTLHDRAAHLLQRAYRDFCNGHYATARRLTTALVALAPLSPEAANLHWFCLAQAEDIDGVQTFEPLIEPAYRAALATQPWLRSGLAWYLHERGDGAAALGEYEILAAAPMPNEITEQYTQALLSHGPPARGWAMLKHVVMARHGAGPPPQWQGESGPGIRLAITNPNGMGDFLNFCRYIPEAARRAQVTLVLAPALHRIAATLCPNLTIVAPHQPIPADYHCTTAHLVPILQPDVPLETIAVPYIHADEDAANMFRTRLARYAGLRVGIVWQGAFTFKWDYKRSLSPERFAPLAAIQGVTLVSLQTGGTAPPFMIDWTAELHDFADTAALIAALDLVISVDTSVVHLAGGLGRPVWLLNFATAEWRWRLGRSSPAEPTPWYPDTLREFRQPIFGDWPSVLRAIEQALRERVTMSEAEQQAN